MAQGINVNLSAKVTGYEASLKDLQTALSKIDLGSSIGKKLSKAIEQAEAQIKSLNKNLTPRATSNTQIDNIVEKTNLAGEAIQNVSRLMQSVSTKDLDFSKFGSGLEEMQKKLDELKGALGEKITEGIQQTIADSEDLSKTFSEILNFDASKATSVEIFEALSNKSKQAAEDVAAAQAEIDKIQSNINKQQASQAAKETGLLGTQQSRDQLQEQARELKAEYEKIFAELRQQMTKGFENLNISEEKRDKLLDSFFQGLTPENIKEHINQLYSSLNAEDLVGKKTEFYEQIFGGGRNIDSVVKNINLGDPQPIIEKFNAFIDSIASQIGGDKAATIKELINKGSIESATNTTIVNLNTAFGRIQRAIQQDKDKINNLLRELATFTDQKTEAEGVKAVVDNASAALEKKVEELEKSNAELRAQISNQQKQIDAFKTRKVDEIKETASGAGLNAEQWKIGREEANKYKTAIEQVQAREKLVGKIEGVVQRWFSIYAVVRMVSNAIKSVISTIKELDKTITEIAIVTNMTQDELWGQMSSYTEMARQYASSISGVYKVSQLYYQQGLQTADVMALTEQTLKMARISGLDYAEATNYMTNAVRSFKMEMTDAQRVVDVYSEIAASSATSTAELASAMSKTASSANAVGSSFENTTAMMAVMIEATRESAENIGSALKSIISRYGEMKEDPAKLIDSEGEEMSLNKVDKALKSVGITLQDTNHQFRDFDDVIFELAGKWDTIDKNTQRYIATVMAGNRQQSRFLALVSSGDRLAELSEKAAESEDAAALQVLKTMDSIEAKTQQFKTSLQSLYTDAGIQDLYKGLLDFGNAIVKTFTNFAKEMGTPLAAVAKFGVQFASLANIVTTVFGLIKARLTMQTKALQGEMTAETMRGATERIEINSEEVIAITKAYEQGIINYETYQNRLNQLATEGVNTRTNIQQGEFSNTRGGITKSTAKWGMALNLAGSMASLAASQISEKTQPERTGKAWLTGFGATAQGAGLGSMFGLKGMAIGAVLGTISGAIEAIGIATENTEEKIKNLNDTIEETSNKKIQSKDDLKTLIDYKKEYEELAKTRNQDAESREKWIKLNNEIAANYPELIKNMDMEGNYVVDMTTAYQQLAEAKLGAYKNDFLSNMSAELQGLNDIDYVLSKIYNVNPIENNWNLIGKAFSTSQSVGQDSTNQFINYLLGLSEEMPSMTVDTIEHLFGSKTQGLVSSSYLPGFGGLPGKYFESINEKYEGASEQLLQQFYDLSQAGLSLEEAKTELKQQYNDSTLLAAIDGFNSDVYNYLLSAGKAIEFQDTLIQNKINQGNQEWLNIISQMYDLEPSSIQNALALQELNSAWEKYYSSNASRLGELEVDEDGINYHTVDAGVLYQEFINQYEGQWLNQFIDDNKQFADEALSELYDQAGRYNRSTYISKLKSINIADEDLNKLIALYDEAYTEAVEQFRESVTSHFEKGTFEYARAVELSEIIPPDFFDTVNEKIQQIYDNDLLTDGIKTEQFNAFSKVIRFIDQLPELQKTTAYSALEHADLTSLTGIYDFLDSLKDAGLDLDDTELKTAILDFGSTLSLNLATEFNTFAQSVISKSEDFGKALSKAEKGMDLKEASETAERLGINLSDFSYRNGKFFIDDATKIYDAYIQYNTDLETALNEEVTNLTNAIENYDLDKIFGDTSDLIANEWYDKDHIEDAIKGALVQNGRKYTDEDVTQLVKIYTSYYEAAEAANMSVEEYINEQIAQGNEDLAIIRQALNYNTNVSLIKAGQLNTLLDNFNIFGQDRNDILELISKGKFDQLSAYPQLAEYVGILQETYKNINSNIYNAMTTSIQSGPQYIEVNELNKDILAKFSDDGLARAIVDSSGEIVGYFVELTENNIDEYVANIKSDSNLSQSQKKSGLQTAHDFRYKDKLGALAGFTDESISYSAILDFAEAVYGDVGLVDDVIKDFGLTLDETTGKYVRGAETLTQLREKLAQLRADGADQKSINAVEAQILEAENQPKRDITSTVQSLLNNRNAVEEDIIKTFADNIVEDLDDLINSGIFTSNGDGTYKVNLKELKAKIDKLGGQFGEEYIKYLGQIVDSISDSFTNATSMISNGTNDYQKAFDFVNDYNDLLNTNESFDTLFNWDAQSNTWKLTAKAYQAYQLKLIETAQEAEASSETVTAMLETSAEELANTIDVSSFLESLGTTSESETEAKFDEAIASYNASLEVLRENGVKTIELNAETLKDNLRAGGEEAVAAARAIATAQGRTLSENEIEAAYRAQLIPLENAFEQLSYGVGSIVSGEAKIILESVDSFNLVDLGDGSAIITSVGDLSEAYLAYYNKLRETNEATTAALNDAMAKVLESREDIDVISALGDAASMSYTRLGEIFASKGIELTEDVLTKYEGIIKSLGNGKVRIVDFDRFANEIMGWTDIDTSSEEYISAFKSYNDSLIEMNRKAESNILEEAKSVASAQGGDWINLTQLSETLNKTIKDTTFSGYDVIEFTALDELNEKLANYGAVIEDGILKINSDADILGIAQAVAQTAQETGTLIPSELAELADAIADAIKQYADLLRGGISGSLTNVQAEQLQGWAKQFDMELDFTPTAEGLKIATNQAIELYQELNKIDSIQGKLVFDDLVSSLSSDKGNRFENISKTTAEIAKAQRELYENNRKIDFLQKDDAKTNANDIQALKEKNSKLREQIGLYKQIQQAQSIDASQYNFMDRDLPETMQGPINYWNSVGEAYKTLNEAGQTGRMEIQDFTNIVNEMSNLAQISGQKMLFFGQEIDGSAETAAALIRKGYGALSNIDGEGVKVDLSKMGIDFAAGADNAKNNFDKGVKALAKSQIEMLDAAIRVLEVVVAMEKLGDIDVDKDNQLDLSEIFNINTEDVGDFTKGFHDWAENIKEIVESGDYEDLKAGLESISINGSTLKDMIYAATGSIEEQKAAFEKLNMTEQEYATVINAFYQAALNGDYNLDTIQQSVWDILDKTLPDGTVINTGDRTIIISGSTHTVIDWENPDYQTALDYLDGEKQTVIDAITHYSTGEATAVEVVATLITKGSIKVNSENGNIVLPDGGEIEATSARGKAAIAETAIKSTLEEAGITEGETIDYTFDDGDNFVSAKTNVFIGTETFIVLTDSNGNVKWTNPDVLPGAEFNTKEQCMRATAERFQAMYAAEGEEIGLDEIYEQKFGVDFKPLVEINLDLNEPDIRAKALDVATSTKEIIASYINDPTNTNYTIVSKVEGMVTYNLDGVEVSVEDTGSLQSNIAAAQSKAMSLIDPEGMIDKIAAGIKTAFTGDDSIGRAIGEGIVAAVTSGKIEGTVTVPEVDATLTTLNITNVDNVGFKTGGIGEALARMVGMDSDLTIPEMNASVEKLTIADTTELDTQALTEQVTTAGTDIGAGLVAGIEAATGDVTSAATALGEAAIEGANDGAQTHSPSKATEQTGKDLVSGLVVGMSDTSAAVTAAQTLAQTVIQTIQNYFNSNPIAISTSMGTNTSTPQTPQTPSVDTAGLAAVQAAIASISAAGQAATASITTLNNNLNNISDNGSAKATDFQAALNKITDVGKTKAESFQTALAAIGNNGQLKAEAFQAALSKIGNNGYLKATAFQSALSKISNIGAERANAFRDALKSIGQTGITRANSFASAVNGVGSSGVANANNFRNALNGISRSGPDHAANFKKALNNINQTTLKINVKVTTTGASAQVTGNLNPWWSWAKGNVSSSNSHVALASGKAKTLMGELGPELVVSNGRYFLVGENGPEMVDLADDAIVFNHLQTKKLMKNGSVNTHGQPVTNEKKATSMATGSFAGDAFASASEALAYLKQLREMWKSLLGASAKELGALAGKGHGSGGSGGGSDTDPSGTSERSTTADIERWYNLLRQIDKLEQDITYQQQLQNKLTSDRNANGRALYNSYKAELDALDQEIAKSRELATIQKSWYDAKRRELNNSEYSKIFTYNENGLQQYTQGRGRGLDILEHLTATNANGQPVGDAATASSQLAYLKKVGFNIESLLVGSDGSRVAYRGADGKLYDKDNKELTGQELADAQAAMMENFWDNVDGWKDEMDSLYDSYHEQEQNILETEQRRNEILQKLVDNQLSLEQTILKAVEDMRQAEIDNLQDERDAYEESVNKMVAGLNESLSNERKIYESQQDNTELNRLQRQLALLQRTGGSGASIRSLQEQIESKQQDMYFTERQNEIDAIQEAADRQIERLDEQINIMTETLAYQKENGLLWKDVYTVMQGTPAEVADFITANAQEWSSKSTLAQSEDLRALKQIIETYTAQRNDSDNSTNKKDNHDWKVFAEANKKRYKDIWRDEKDNVKEIFNKKFKETGDSNQASRAATDYLNQKMRDRRTQQVEPEVEEVEIVLGEDSGNGSGGSGGGSKNSGGSDGGSDRGGSQGQPPVQQATLSPKEKAQKYGKQVAAAIWEYPGGSGWGNGGTREKNITAKGMDYSIVQGYVNQMTKKNRKQRLSMAGLSSVSELAPYTFAGFAFKNGGPINYTGPAWVDGSPSRPEYILNAEQTAALRKQLISSKTSHQNLIGEAISAADKIANASTSTNNSTNTDNSIGINNLNFTMQVAKIADDYDAKKAGEKVMNEMVRIARKNGDRSVSRR